MNIKHYEVVIIGGGAAGFFSAIRCAESLPPRSVLLLEKSQKLLSKVKISGGGRCNVTHACFQPVDLVKNYPRGSKELRGPFSQFQPLDTIEWFEKRGVAIKKEEDGRMFPITDDSQTIIDCLMAAAKDVDIQCGQQVMKILPLETGFSLQLRSGDEITSKFVILATGSARAGHDLSRSLSHTIIEPIASLFTFNIPDSPLEHLSGVSVDEVTVTLPQFHMDYQGPLLITHWGFSGPAVLKLSAFCARELHDCGYQTNTKIDWSPNISENELRRLITEKKSKKCVANEPIISIPKQLWKVQVQRAGIDETIRWTGLSKLQKESLVTIIKRDEFQISGKTTYKQEFVTCGGVKLSEVHFKTMESKLVPNLFFCGEILDVDGITGGFNFQAAWTTGWLAGQTVQSRN
jgi:predicted Rossmann fold flavoprotein